MPAARGEQHGSRLVLEHPAGEVASAPVAARADHADRSAGTPRRRQDPSEQQRHPVVGDEVMANRPTRRSDVATSGCEAPAAMIDSAASRPLSSAWPMPSPVITSVTVAASPTNSVRPTRERHLIDASRDRPRGVPVLQLEAGAECVDDVRALEQVVPDRPSCVWIRRSPSRSTPKPMLTRPSGQRERPRVAGREVRLEPDVELLAAGPVTLLGVLTEAVPFAEVAGLAGAERLAHRAPHAVGRHDVAGGDRAGRRRATTTWSGRWSIDRKP